MDRTLIKRNGVHYTPPALADFLADQVAEYLPQDGPVRILDPACGHGQLLASMAQRLPDRPLELVGFDRDDDSISACIKRLQTVSHDCQISRGDFLEQDFEGFQPVECLIANPPYVRTQVLGAKRAQKLAARFGLKGRVDLYQAFAVAMESVLAPDGAMGLLTSNRFLSIAAGKSLRRFLESRFDLKVICDLGETRMFEAAVLPAIVVATKKNAERSRHQLNSQPKPCRYIRLVKDEQPSSGRHRVVTNGELLERVATGKQGAVSTDAGRFEVQYGALLVSGNHWQLSTPKSSRFLARLNKHTATTLGEIANVKVGIKTTADKIFVRDQWELVLERSGLIHPLITHHDAKRWRRESAQTKRRVLYPYDVSDKQPNPVSLNEYRNVGRYLKTHFKKLNSRSYLTEARRQWYEIWVPHQPNAWAQDKIVWPEISVEPRFFLDRSGAIVNGDCYWLTLKDGVHPDWMYLILAVANSKVATEFYDVMFHNKLYAGRRRFMTQYVSQFPLPELNLPHSKKIISMMKRLLKQKALTVRAEQTLDQLVEQAFGLG